MDDWYVGEIRMMAFSRAPQGWLLCDGASYAPGAHPDLFRIIGTTYGGDGQATFAVPDFRGRIAVDFGAGPGLSAYAMGQTGGREGVVLAPNQMPAHQHTLSVRGGLATTADPGPTVMPGVLDVDSMYLLPSEGNAVVADPNAVGLSGGQPHPNCMPTQAISYCIAFEGAFPPP